MMITSCGGSDQPAQPPKTTAALAVSQSEGTDIATEAYVYAYPLVTMEYTRRSFTNVPGPEETKAYLPPLALVSTSIDMVTSARKQVNALGAPEYFTLFAHLLKTNPPAQADAPVMAKLARIGIVAGQDFDPSKLPAAAATGIAMAPKLGQDNISGWREDGVVASAFVSRNGWAYTIKAGSYGTNYRQWAFVTEVGVGANLPEDAVYPMYGSNYSSSTTH